jgi:hypothetical protein
MNSHLQVRFCIALSRNPTTFLSTVFNILHLRICVFTQIFHYCHFVFFVHLQGCNYSYLKISRSSYKGKSFTSMRGTIDWVEVMHSFCCFHSMHTYVCVYHTELFLSSLSTPYVCLSFSCSFLSTYVRYRRGIKEHVKHLRKVTSSLVYTQSSWAANANDDFTAIFSCQGEKKTQK